MATDAAPPSLRLFLHRPCTSLLEPLTKTSVARPSEARALANLLLDHSDLPRIIESQQMFTDALEFTIHCARALRRRFCNPFGLAANGKNSRDLYGLVSL